MGTRYFNYDAEAWRFKSISEFKSSVNRGAEINFQWNGREYHICPIWPNGTVRYCIIPLDTLQETVYDNANEMLGYTLGSDHLRDVVTQLIVCDRTL